MGGLPSILPAAEAQVSNYYAPEHCANKIFLPGNENVIGRPESLDKRCNHQHDDDAVDQADGYPACLQQRFHPCSITGVEQVVAKFQSCRARDNNGGQFKTAVANHEGKKGLGITRVGEMSRDATKQQAVEYQKEDRTYTVQ